MQRVHLKSLGMVLLIGSTCYGQSLADAARANRKQKSQEGATVTKVVSDDDIAAATDVTVHLVPGATSTGGGELIPECGNTIIPLPTWMQQGFPTAGFFTSRSH